MKQINYKKLILPNIPYVFFVYLFDKAGQAVRLAPGADISAKILNIAQGFSEAFSNALPSVYPLDLLVTQTERLTMNSRPKQPKYARNKNVVVIGGSGSGKTRFFVKPNLMQLHSSYVLTDPKGTVLIECERYGFD